MRDYVDKQEYESKIACIKEDCGSSDAMTVFLKEDEEGVEFFDAFCYSCRNFFSHTKLYKAGVVDEEPNNDTTNKTSRIRPMATKPPISEADLSTVRSNTITDTTGFRGIHPKVNKKYDVLSEFDKDGQMMKRYYPVTRDGKLIGYKIRITENKLFFSMGASGKDSDLFNQTKFREGGKYVLLTGGEEDAMAAFQMLRKYQIDKGNEKYDPVPCLSPSTSESASVENVKRNYAFLDTFDQIILCLDNDKVGKESSDKLADMLIDVLPHGKVYVMDLPEGCKDPNDALRNRKASEFINNFYKAKKYLPEAIISSSGLSAEVRKEVMTPKIPLPPFMSQLQKMTAGGFPLGHIINIASGSGVGKTTIINEIIYHWIFKSPHKMGVVSLELSKGQYGLAMLSRHVGRKISLIENQQEALDFLDSPMVVEKEKELYTDSKGEARWYLIDERDGSVKRLQQLCKQLIKACGVKVIVFDPLSDVIASLSLEEQEKFMGFQKSMVKEGVTFININHVRKSTSGEKSTGGGKDLVEDDIQGSSSIYKSGSINILVSRNKYAEDEVERNTTRVTLGKCRTTGLTGKAGDWYYDNNTHTLHDKETFLANNSVEGVVSKTIKGMDKSTQEDLEALPSSFAEFD